MTIKNKIFFLDKLYINFKYYFITCIIFSISKKYKNLAEHIKIDPPKNIKSKLYIIAYYKASCYADKNSKMRKKIDKYIID